MSDTPTNPENAIPSDAGMLDVAGTQPLNPFVRALLDAKTEALQKLDEKTTRDQIVRGVFTFLSMEFPMAAPELGAVEPLIQRFAEWGSK